MRIKSGGHGFLLLSVWNFYFMRVFFYFLQRCNIHTCIQYYTYKCVYLAPWLHFSFCCACLFFIAFCFVTIMRATTLTRFVSQDIYRSLKFIVRWQNRQYNFFCYSSLTLSFLCTNDWMYAVVVGDFHKLQHLHYGVCTCRMLDIHRHIYCHMCMCTYEYITQTLFVAQSIFYYCCCIVYLLQLTYD